MSLSKDIGNFNNKTEKDLLKTFRGSFLAMASKIIVRTPVKEGRARGNWQTSINSPLSGETNDSQSQAIGNTVNKSSNVKLGDSLYLVNNLPYIQKLEDGSSKQAPSGMVKVTQAEYQQIVDKEAKR